MDLETTRRACRRYHFRPVTILNFPEGTRFSPSKQRRQRAPFRHLLRPKAGGLAFALEAMEGRISRMLDVTIVYPGGDSRFWSFLAGGVARVTVHIRDIRIPADLLRGGYADDARCREAFQQWIRNVWQEKDALIERLLAENAAAPGEGRPGPDRG
jgi:1-acyl-sn-glycerol-3-phosphate acyltransferase